MGLKRDDFRLQDTNLGIGLRVVNRPWRNTETARILKSVARNERESPLRRTFPSSPMIKEILFGPEYRIFVVGEDALINEIQCSLNEPSRPLYLGQSDDFAVISNLECHEASQCTSDSIFSVAEGIHENCEILRLPFRYDFTNGIVSLQYKTISVPNAYPYQLKKEISCYNIGRENVAIY